MTAAYWLGNLAAWSAQCAVLIAAGAAAAWVFRLRLPHVRLVYWQALLAICLLLPAVEPWRNLADGQVDVTMGPPRVITSGRAPAVSLPWRQALLLALACGCLARTAWLAVGFARLHRWRRTSMPLAPLPPHLDRLRAAVAPRADFRLASALSGPVTFGLVRPLILLPDGFAQLPIESQKAIACHELLHVRRHDWILTIAEELAKAVLWFHPAAWWLAGQIQLAREQTVDGEVVRLTRDRRQYLDALLAIAGNRPLLDLAPATLFLRKRHLKKRVALLLEEIAMSKRRLISFCAASCGMLFAAGWLVLHTFPLQAAPAPQEAPQSKLLVSVRPQYPPQALEKRIEGAVVLEAHIDAEGRVSDAKVLSGPEELRNAALTAILQWRYSPTAMTLPTITEVTMEFRLPKDGPPVTTTQAIPPAGPPFTLNSIEIEGLSDEAREKLLQGMPVHVGDTIEAHAMRLVWQTVRSFDDHLVVIARPADGTLVISSAPPAPVTPPTKIRVGGNVQQAKLIVKVQPVYPPEAKAQGIEGIVRLEATIGKTGDVENLVVLDGPPILSAAAIDAVRQWQYQTTLLNGDPVEVVTEINVNFTLAK